MTGSAEPQRVLMTADAMGGVWTYALDLAHEFGRRGIAVTLATMGRRPNSPQRAAARGIPDLDLFESDFKLEWMDDPWDDVQRAGEWLLGLAARLRPDIVHLNGYAHAALPWPAPAIVVGHSCVLSWWQAVKHELAPAALSRYRDEVRRGLASASMLVCPTLAMLRCLQTHYPGAIGEAAVIPNGRDQALFRPDTKEPFILAAGRLWDEAKNLRALESAAAQLPWPVYVAGEDRHPDGHSRESDGVCRLGNLAPAEVARYPSRAPIYALPARYEPFGLSVLEAALSGCALVLGDIPSLRENWNDAALFVSPDDTDQLAAALRLLIDNPSLRADLADTAYARALNFTPERMAVGYLSVYRSAATKAACAS